MTSVYSAPLVKAASRALQLVLFIIASTEATQAQHSTSYRVGFVSAASSVSMATRLDAFSRGLRELGYVDGQNISIFLRWGEGSDERLPSLTSELVLLKVDVIVSHGVLATIAACAASTTIP